MNQRSALLIAAALTAFLLVLAGGLASRLSTTTTEAAATAVPTEALQPTQVVTLDPTVEALIKEREAAYQQALTDANNRLNQANAQIAQANAQINTLEQSRQQIANQASQAQAASVAVAAPATAPAGAPKATAAPAYAISATKARDIALGVAAPGAALLKAPELVNYQGTPAYEVSLDKGLVYVDAQSGKVLLNGAAAPKLISQDQAIQAAQAYLGGGSVKSVQLQQDNGGQTYQVLFSDNSKVYVDAISGQVVYAEIRTPDTQYASGGGEHESSEGGEHESGEHESGEHESGGGEHEGHGHDD
jgi:uncharacterized membrane protein YkoI